MYRNETETSSFVRHEPCPSCSSKDNLARYTDHAYCFGCGYQEQDGKVAKTSKPKEDSKFIEFEYRPLNRRKLKEDTCRKWSYGLGTYKGEDSTGS